VAVTSTLADYVSEVRRILHDATGTFWSDVDLIAFINRAIRQRDRNSYMNRVVVTTALVQGQKLYDLTLVDPDAHDVISIFVIRGNERYPLAKRPYTEVTQYNQAIVSMQTDPEAFARVGATQVYIAPTPRSALPTEWDVVRVAPALVSLGDADPLPYPWTDPVPFLAASFAKYESQQAEEARLYDSLYRERLADILAESQTRMLPDVWGGLPRY
jgi:hypothetical protein